MIAKVKTDNKFHAANVQFSALKFGLVTERDDNIVSIAYADPYKVLNVIKEAGGQIVGIQESA